MKTELNESFNWLLFWMGIIVLMEMAIFNFSVESSHVTKRQITYDHGLIKQIITYDSSVRNFEVQQIYIWTDARNDFYKLLD